MEENPKLDMGSMLKWERVALFALFEVYLEQPELFDDEAKIGIEKAMDDIKSEIGKLAIQPGAHNDTQCLWD